jgi:hypothetical protein
MTDTMALMGEFIVQGAVQPQGAPAAGAAQRFDALMSAPAQSAGPAASHAPRHDTYVERVPDSAPVSRPALMPQSFFEAGNDLSNRMRATFEKSAFTQPVDAERFPEVAIMQNISLQTREFMLLDMQIHFASKSVEIADKGLQTLYKQQG